MLYEVITLVDEEPPSELEYEPDLSTLFQDEAAKTPDEQVFDFSESFTFDDSDEDSDAISESEDGEEELTSYDLGFVDEDSDSNEIAIVITSYSIHYTKLYDKAVIFYC